MKKIIIFTLITLITINSFAQTQLGNNVNQKNEHCNLAYTYKLFPTEILQTFIKLNTRTGQMWHLQFDEKEKNRKETSLNTESLVEKEKEIDNRFTIYATQNLWTFILLDQIDGTTWQVMWSANPNKIKVVPIE